MIAVISVVSFFVVTRSGRQVVVAVRLLLADKQEIFREGLAKLLEDEPSIDVVCTCCTGLEAVEKSANEYHPDVILIDEEGLSMDSRSICRALNIHPTVSSIPVIVIGGNGHHRGLEDLSNVVCIQRPVDPLYLMAMVGWI